MAKTTKKNRYKEFHIQYVYEHFCDVMSKYIKKKGAINELFDDVVKRYSVKNRHYHNMQHIFGVVSMWDAHKHLLCHPDEIFVAAIYHDIVYNPKKQNNEFLSAVYFEKKVLPLIKSKNFEGLFVTLAILATIHDPESHKIYKKEHNKDILYLLDFDLETLGTRHQSTYDWYKDGVRKEYKMYSDEEYNQGRIKVLQSFLDRKKIYLTKEFKKIEKNARKNLQNEINSYICHT